MLTVNEKVFAKIVKENEKKELRYRKLTLEEESNLKEKAQKIINNFEIFFRDQLEQGIDPWFNDSEKRIIIHEQPVCKNFHEEQTLHCLLSKELEAKI